MQQAIKRETPPKKLLTASFAARQDYQRVWIKCQRTHFVSASSSLCCYLLPTNMGGTYHFCVSFQREDVHIACVCLYGRQLFISNCSRGDTKEGPCGGCLTLIAPHKKLNRCCGPGAGGDEHWKPKSQQSGAQDPSQIERQITPIGWVGWKKRKGGVAGNEYEYWQANNFIHKQTAETESDVTPAKQTDAGDAWEGFMEFIYGQHQHQEQQQRWLHVCER